MNRIFNRSQATVARAAMLLALAVVYSGCGDDQLKTVATNVDRAALLVKDGREVRDELFAQGVIDRDDAYKVTLALVKVNSALQAFNNRAQTYKDAGGLTPEGKSLLKKLANDISSAATELVSDGTFGVKSPDAQARINAAIGSIRQVALAIVDAVSLLKTKPAPIQQAGIDPLSALPLALLVLRQILEFIARERARTGKTTEEIFAEASVQIDENDLALIEDLVKYAPNGDLPAELD
jgi:hypothetical protein